MKTVIYYQWNESREPFGVFSNRDEADKALAAAADNIKTTVENLKADLYYYELPLNKLVIADMNIILD